MNLFLPLLVLLPFPLGVGSYCIGRVSRKARDWFVLGCVVVEALVLLCLSPSYLAIDIPGLCGLGLTFRLGGLRTILALLAATGWVSATVLSREYFVHVNRRNRYYMFWLFTLGATLGVFLSGDLFTAFVFFEIMSFTSFVAVVQTESPEALQAGDTYLAVAVIGGMATLTGLFLLQYLLGTLDFSAMGQAAAQVEDRGLLWAAGVLTLVGFGAKAGAFPLHIWLPTAHPAAPAPASAVLSGVITKTGIYGVLMLSTTVFLYSVPWGALLAVIGGITMVLGAVLAVLSTDLKRTLACSSISQIGFILVGISMQCLLGEHNALAVDGTVLHIVNHSLIKMALFPAAGVIHLSTHSFRLDDLRGFGRGKPLLAAVMGLPMLSLSGLPLLSGYVSKTLLHESIVEYAAMAGEWAWAADILEGLFLLTGGLTFAYMLKLFFCIFGPKPPRAREWRERKARYIAPASGVVLLCYAALTALLGLTPSWTMDAVAAAGRGLLHGHPPARPVDYFSTVNLQGAAISLSIGAVVYLLVVRTLLISRDRRYLQRLPGWVNLEFGLYRPALVWGVRLLVVVASLLDRLLLRTVWRGMVWVSCQWRDTFTPWADRVSLYTTGQPYTERHSVEQTVEDTHFARYSDQLPTQGGFSNSFAFGLLLTGAGLVFAILFIILQ